MFLHDNNSVFADLSQDANEFLRDEFTVDFVAIEDVLYIGLYKPFNSVYFEFKTPLAGDLSFTINGNALAVKDDTRNFLRSGFIEFDKPKDWILETINGIEAFWVKINSSIDFVSEIQGVNTVYADDNDLKENFRDINSFLAKGDISFIAYHVAARNEIIQRFRNGGFIKEDNSVVDGNRFANIGKWDLLDLGEMIQNKVIIAENVKGMLLVAAQK